MTKLPEMRQLSDSSDQGVVYGYTDEGLYMQFEMTHIDPPRKTVCFDEHTAPDWLTSAMCYRWFWTDRVLTLGIGQSVDTDFRTIRRTA